MSTAGGLWTLGLARLSRTPLAISTLADRFFRYIVRAKEVTTIMQKVLECFRNLDGAKGCMKTRRYQGVFPVCLVHPE